jgi:flavin-dependent dehydrogenase
MRRHPNEVTVIGGGPAGAATAIALARKGVRVRLVEASTHGKSLASESVPPEVVPPLRELGVWESFERDGHLPSDGARSAWGSDDLAYRDAMTHPLGGGWHIDRDRFDSALVAEAGRSGVEILTGSRVVRAEARGDDGWSLEIRGPEGIIHRLFAGFLVDATGRRAALARLCSVRRLHFDRLVAVSASFPLPYSTPAGGYTLVEAVDEGWWYAARSPGGRGVAAFFSDGDLVRGLGLFRLGPWYQLLDRTRHVRDMLGGPPEPRHLRVMSAATQCLPAVHGEGWVAVGDAAAAWDPLASAGVVLALRSGLAAASAVARHLEGDGDALSDYGRGIELRFTRYLQQRDLYYAAEGRWRRSPFWRRRNRGAVLWKTDS